LGLAKANNNIKAIKAIKAKTVKKGVLLNLKGDKSTSDFLLFINTACWCLFFK
jgi:hypothetical protein